MFGAAMDVELVALLGCLGWSCAASAAAAVAVLTRRGRRTAVLVAEAAHELRGPLTVLELGLAGDGTQRRAGAAAALRREVSRAALAVDDLQAALSGGRAGDRPVPTDVGTLLRDVAESLQPLAASRGRAVCAVVPGEPLMVLVDVDRMRQAVGNLAANALRHGAGPVRLRARAGVSGVLVDVEDHGPGLSRPLAHALHGAARRTGLHGHGLAVASHVASDAGGCLADASEPGTTRLRLELPFAHARIDDVRAPGRTRRRLPRPVSTAAGLRPAAASGGASASRFEAAA